jgi:hypothetical protein
MRTFPLSPRSDVQLMDRGMPSRIVARIAYWTRRDPASIHNSSAGIPSISPYMSRRHSFAHSTTKAAPRKMPRAARPESGNGPALPVPGSFPSLRAYDALDPQQPMVSGGRDNWAVTGVSLGRSPMVRRFSNDGHDGWESVGDILARLRTR